MWVHCGRGWRYCARKAWLHELLLGFMEDKGAPFLVLVLLSNFKFANKVISEEAPWAQGQGGTRACSQPGGFH